MMNYTLGKVRQTAKAVIKKAVKNLYGLTNSCQDGDRVKEAPGKGPLVGMH